MTPIAQLILARQFDHRGVKFITAAELIDEAGIERRLGAVSTELAEALWQLRDIGLHIGLGPQAFRIGEPTAPQAAGQCLIGGLGFGRGGGAGEGLHERLVGANAEHVDINLQLFERLGEIEARAAGASDDHAAHRVEPDLAGGGGEQPAVVAVGGGPGVNRLTGFSEAGEGIVNCGDIGLAAAHEAIQFQHNGLDAIILGGVIDGVHHIAHLDFSGNIAGRGIERRGFRGLINQGAIHR